MNSAAIPAYLNPLPGEVLIDRDIVYSRPEANNGVSVDLALDLYRPAGATDSPPPVIIWIHGGGFSAGDKAEMAGLSAEMAQRGYACVSINYRLASDPDHITAATMDKAIADIYAAVGWIGKNAAAYGFDPERIALAGGSAGGALALNALWEEERWVPKAMRGKFFAGIIIAGADPRQTLKIAKTPILLINGDQDSIMPVRMARAVAENLRTAGVRHELLILAGEGHSINAQSRDIELAHILGFLQSALTGHVAGTPRAIQTIVQGESAVPAWQTRPASPQYPAGWSVSADGTVTAPDGLSARVVFAGDRTGQILPIVLVDPVRLELAIAPDAPGQLRCRVISQSKSQTRSGRLEIVPSGETAGTTGTHPNSLNLTFADLAPGKSVEFLIPANLGQSVYRVSAGETWSAEFPQNLKLLVVPRLARIVTIDGDLADWPEPAQVMLDKADESNQIPDWRGPEDLSAGVRFAWDDDCLYLGITVTDDIHVQDAIGWGMWAGDGIQLAIDPRATPESTGNGYTELGLSVFSKRASNQAWRWIAPQGLPTGSISPGFAKVKRTGNRTTYELALPWALLGEKEAHRGQVIRASLLINDNDGAGRRGWITWGKGIGDSKDSSAFNLIQLGDGEPAAAP